MPSLRRTASSPTVRSSPYSHSALAVRENGGHRRSSGSETSSRRVLADIEWWRVTDGQCDPAADQESEDPNRGTQDTVAIDLSALGTGIHIAYVEPASMPLPWIAVSADVSDETSAYAPPTAQFSSLSITPHTPTRRHHDLGLSSPSSPSSPISSLESTPDTVYTPIDGLRATDLRMDMGFLEASLLGLPDHRRSSRYGMLSLSPSSPPILRRSFTDFLALNDDDCSAKQYADFAISPLSSSPDFLN